MVTNTLTGRRQAVAIPAWALLLERFYERSGQSLPPLRELRAEEVPPPYRELLVHSADMTPTLARFYGQALRIRVLGREHRGDTYRREVILWLTEDGRPVEYGAIRIHLERLPPAARQRVLEEELPLGGILHREGVPHLSWPKGYFRIRSDAHAGAALGLQRPGFLYGRRNVLLDGSRHLLAEVIEVLAPIVSIAREVNGKECAGRGTVAGRGLVAVNHRSLR